MQNYYTKLSLRDSAGRSTSDWRRLKKGISGCTIFASLFALATNVLVKSVEVVCKGSLSKSGTRQPPIRAFTDDLTVQYSTTSVPGFRWLLQGLDRLITCASNELNPTKSRSLVLGKDKGDIRIPPTSEKPVKSLGTLFISDLKDTAARQATSKNLTMWFSVGLVRVSWNV